MSSWFGSILFQESFCASQQSYFIEEEKTSMVKGIDELHIDPEEGFMVVKGNSHVIGERRKQKMSGMSICLNAAL
jgi:hypothetical protein